MPRSPAKARPPQHLSNDAKAAWNALVAPGQSPVELMALEALAVQVARAREAGRMVNADGLLTVGPKDEQVPHPALAVERAAHGEIRRWVEGRQVRPGQRSGKEAPGADADSEQPGGWASGLSAQVQHPPQP